MKVTLKQLKRLNACKDQYDLFASLGLDGVEITGELCIKHAQDFDWNWAAHNLLRKPYREAFDLATKPHWEVYFLATEPHWIAYYLATESLWEARALAIKLHREARDLATKPHREAYDLATKPHLEALNLELAKAFFAATQQEK